MQILNSANSVSTVGNRLVILMQFDCVSQPCRWFSSAFWCSPSLHASHDVGGLSGGGHGGVGRDDDYENIVKYVKQNRSRKAHSEAAAAAREATI